MPGSKNAWTSVFWWIPLGVFLALFVWGMEYRFPAVGLDFDFFIRMLLEGRWHWAHYGVSPMWYAVHLCGGLPMHGHPSDLYYSLPQALALVMDPWRALEISVLFFMVIGYGGWMLLGRDVLRFPGSWAHLLALIVTAQGFLFLHVLAGHVNFFTFPLIGWLLWFLLGHSKKRLPEGLRAVLFALLCAMILYAAGFYVLLFFALLLVFASPLVLLCRDSLQLPPWRTVIIRLLSGGAIAVALSASKLVAVWSVMRVFPRFVASMSLPPSADPLFVILRALWAMPQSRGLYPGFPLEIHEYSMVLSPVVLAGVLPLIVGSWMTSGRARLRRIMALLYGVLLGFVCLQLAGGRGPVNDLLHLAPVFSSLRVTFRVLYVFSLLLTIPAVAALHDLLKTCLPRKQSLSAGVAMGITLVAFLLAHAPLLPHLIVPVSYSTIRSSIDLLEAENFTAIPVHTMLPGETDFLGTTGRVCAEDPLLWWAKQPQKKWLKPGSVALVTDGRFNLTNPACFAYPEENDCQPGERIAVTDRANFENFLSGGPLTWKISRLQQAANIVTLLSLLACAGYVLTQVGYRYAVSFRRHPRVQRRSRSR